MHHNHHLGEMKIIHCSLKSYIPYYWGMCACTCACVCMYVREREYAGTHTHMSLFMSRGQRKASHNEFSPSTFM